MKEISWVKSAFYTSSGKDTVPKKIVVSPSNKLEDTVLLKNKITVIKDFEASNKSKYAYLNGKNVIALVFNNGPLLFDTSDVDFFCEALFTVSQTLKNKL